MDIAFTETIVKIEYSESNQDAAIKPPDFDSHSNQVHKVSTYKNSGISAQWCQILRDF